MPMTFTYPDSTELIELEQELIPQIEEDDPVFFSIFPIRNVENWKLEWEQLDNFFGLQQARGLDGQPSPVARIGSNRFSTEPGVYGDFVSIDEKELLTRAAFAKFEGHMDITDLVMIAQRQLLQRRIDRIRYIGWTLLTTGAFLVAAPGGGYEHRDRYAFETITASPGFSNTTTATPLSFFLGLLTKGRGTSSTFDSGSKIYVNATTVQNIINNTNASDGGRIRLNYGQTMNVLEDVNTVLKGRGLPTIEVYDKGYLTTPDPASFQLFIPNGIGVLIGKRSSGSAVGAYRMTLNAFNGFKPGPYTQVVNTFGQESPGVAKLEVHDGHNGGPVVFFPKAVKILNLG